MMKYNHGKYEILTPFGYKDFKGVQTVDKHEYFEITLSNGIKIDASTTHRFIINGDEVEVQNLSIGDILDGGLTISEINYINSDIKLFDVVGVADGNLFISDGVVSHNCDFISSGHTVIEGEILQWYKESMVREPIEKRYGGEFWLWDRPNYSKDYIVVADVARGDGEDYSAFHVFEVETMEQVAEFKAKIGTREYGHLLVSVATEWNNALLVIDNKNMGWDVVQVAIDRNYQNLYYSYRNDPYFDENIQLRKNYDLKDKKDMIPGFTTGHKARMTIISKLEIYLRERAVNIRSVRTVNELFVFLWINGKAQAQSGYNDDLVMALGMALFVRDTALRLRQVGIELTKRAIATSYKSVYTPQRGGSEDWKMKLGGTKGTDDLRWLLERRK